MELKKGRFKISVYLVKTEVQYCSNYIVGYLGDAR